MATKVKRNAPDILDESGHKNDWQQLVDQVRTYPYVYGSIVVFIVICILLGSMYRINSAGKSRSEMTRFATALDMEKPAERAAALQPIAAGSSTLSAESLYISGESFIEAKEYDKAKEAFERLRRDFPNVPEVPNAVEGLGFLLENKGDYEGALALYKEVSEKWPTALVSRHQDLNIGRCQEHLGKFEEADKSYTALLEKYVGSGFGNEAKMAQEKLREAHPELVPKPAVATEQAAPAASAPAPAAETPAAPAPAPAAETPAAPAPAPAAAQP